MRFLEQALGIRHAAGRMKRGVWASLLPRIPATSKQFGPPRGVRWVSDLPVRGIAECVGQLPSEDCRIEVLPRETMNYPPARTVDPEGHWKFSGEAAAFGVPEGRVTVIPGGRVLGSDPIIIDSNDAVVMESSCCSAPYLHPVFWRIRLPEMRRIDDPVLVLAIPPKRNVAHWMFDSMERFWLFEMLASKMDLSNTWFVVDPPGFHYVDAVLERFGIPEERRIIATPDLHLECACVIVPSVRGQGHPTPAFIDWLRSRAFLGSDNAETKGRRLYISRQQARFRRVLNEQAVEEALSPHGFEVLVLEDMTFAEQVRAFRHAEVIVGAHGAGFANLAFCPASTRVLELMPPEYVNLCFYCLAAVQGMSYHFLIGKGKRPNDQGDYFASWNAAADIDCDLALLEQALKELLN